MKFCKKCNTNKSVTEFYKRSAAVDGLANYCKACSLEYDRKHRPRKYKPFDRNAEERPCRKCERPIPRGNSYCNDCQYVYQSARQIRRYGITPDQYLAILKKQGYVCAICKKPEKANKRLSIDHDHSCCNFDGNHRACGNCIRGLLCSSCNRILGLALDSDQTLLNAANYLKRFTNN